MRIAVILLAFSSILYSCQKEIDFANGNTGGGGSTSGTLLVKTVSKSGSDSVVTVYTYDGNKRIMNEKSVGMTQGFNAGNEFRYYRNAAGIITHYVQINANLVTSGIDSVTTIVHYNSASARYSSTVSEISFAGFSVLDSTVFIYDANGKVIESDLYLGIPFVGGYDLSDKFKYTYAGNGNITKYDTYDLTSGTEDLIATTKYTYDAKTSALSLPNTEAFAIGFPDQVAVNNATKVEILDLTNPSNNYTIDMTFAYNSNNRPATGVSTQTPGSIVNNLTYYYQ